jgi:hypothetical protein
MKNARKRLSTKFWDDHTGFLEGPLARKALPYQVPTICLSYGFSDLVE